MIVWVEKGYSIEYVDGRKHTALSEAACQGHLHVVKYLIEEGANPNSLSDVSRSPIWRASFGGHTAVVEYLLQAGADPTHRDVTSMESAFDVAKTDELRTTLVSIHTLYTASNDSVRFTHSLTPTLLEQLGLEGDCASDRGSAQADGPAAGGEHQDRGGPGALCEDEDPPGAGREDRGGGCAGGEGSAADSGR